MSTCRLSVFTSVEIIISTVTEKLQHCVLIPNSNFRLQYLDKSCCLTHKIFYSVAHETELLDTVSKKTSQSPQLCSVATL